MNNFEILHTIDTTLLNYNYYFQLLTEQAVDTLKAESLTSHFEKGLKIVQQKMTVSRHRQKQIAAHLLDTPNVYYRSTIVNEING